MKILVSLLFLFIATGRIVKEYTGYRLPTDNPAVTFRGDKSLVNLTTGELDLEGDGSEEHDGGTNKCRNDTDTGAKDSADDKSEKDSGSCAYKDNVNPFTLDAEKFKFPVKTLIKGHPHNQITERIAKPAVETENHLKS